LFAKKLKDSKDTVQAVLDITQAIATTGQTRQFTTDDID
jgi:hypothetical protein